MEANSNDEIIHWAGFDSSYFHLDAAANAALIVEAVNAYDSLLARNKRLTEALENLSATVREVRQKNTNEFLEYLRDRELKARAALAEDKEQTHGRD